jgi:hypothetical protein
VRAFTTGYRTETIELQDISTSIASTTAELDSAAAIVSGPSQLDAALGIAARAVTVIGAPEEVEAGVVIVIASGLFFLADALFSSLQSSGTGSNSGGGGPTTTAPTKTTSTSTSTTSSCPFTDPPTPVNVVIQPGSTAPYRALVATLPKDPQAIQVTDASLRFWRYTGTWTCATFAGWRRTPLLLSLLLTCLLRMKKGVPSSLISFRLPVSVIGPGTSS